MELSQIDQLLADRVYRSRFPAEIEAAYHAHRLNYRKHLARALIIPTLICYNAFLLVDYLIVPELFWLSVQIHLLVVTPLFLASIWVFFKSRGPVVRDTAAILPPVAMVAQIMTIYALSAGNSEASHYQYLAVMVLVYTNLLYRLEYRHALVASMVIVTIYLGTLLGVGASAPVLQVGAMMIAIAAYLSLSANRQMQWDARLGFLRRLQDQARLELAEREAEKDVLTGLFNRRRLEKELANRAGSGARPLAILMIDVDHFKPFNDYYGHLVGDLSLKRVAAVIRSSLPGKDDLAVRYGGEEFLVFLDGADFSQAYRVAERIRTGIVEMAIPHEGAEDAGLVTASVGLMAACVPPEACDALIAGADSALYAAKQAGRNRVWPPVERRGAATRGASQAPSMPVKLTA
ncbi:GGDEF domain-containing protein [Jiella marina]|uniref:GGDEF domain-containing protein n=1 Tax=Jiella sp. LLJ827 TaxID=2917712 RepID=UPI002100D7EC|nr:GGDEF domain-containing protein [Jiella sp. LLJ827]MCQ0986775.1 GGDEF domain-containing protein [Jiella sp. LLJ827]